MFSSTTYTLKKMATVLGVHPDTLRHWERTGILVPEKVGKGSKKVYTEEHIRQAHELNLIPDPEKEARELDEKYGKYTKEQLINELETLKNKRPLGLVWEESEKEEVVEQCKREAPILQYQAAKRIFTDKNKPNNILIEGDNYHALQVLNYTHAGKIDVIYIDPPYNTNNDKWVYNDRYVDINDRFRHSKWLNMMKPRLKLAKNLLNQTGIIFISIDDNEQAHLKLLCNEIFGEENFIANLVWENREGGGSGDSKHFKTKHEYILAYGKAKEDAYIDGVEIEDEPRYKLEDNHVEERGKYQLVKLNSASIQYSKSLDYAIESPNGEEIHPSENGQRACWRWGKEKVKWGIANDFIVIQKTDDKNWTVYSKQYLKVDNENNPQERDKRQIAVIDKFSTTQSNKKIKELFGQVVFSYTKPVPLIGLLLKISAHSNAQVLDFFAGSGTTGHAVLELNKEDGGNRKFILCTSNENHNGNGKGGIVESVCYPRIKKVIKGYSYTGEGKKDLYSKDIKNYTDLKSLNINDAESVRNDNKTKFDKVTPSYKNGVLKVEGINNIDGRKKGLGGNLEYFKTAFIDVENIRSVPDNKKLDFTHEAGRILALKEDCLTEVEYNNHYQIFTNGAGKHVGIYFRGDRSQLKKLDSKILGKPEVKMYIFTYNANPSWRAKYAAYDNVTVEDIPEPILQVYREVNL